MSRSRTAARSRIAVAVSVAALGVAGCSSSGGGGASTPASQSAPTSSASSSSAPASSAPAAGSSSAGGKNPTGANKKACADLNELKKVNKLFDGVGQDLTKGKLLLAQLSVLTGRLAQDAPSSIAAISKSYAADVNTLTAATNRVKSVPELNQLTRTDPTLKAAATRLTVNGGKLQTYFNKTC